MAPYTEIDKTEIQNQIYTTSYRQTQFYLEI